MRVKVEFEVDVPDVEATEEDVIEWLRFSFHDNGDMKIANPLSSKEPEPVSGTFDLMDADTRRMMF